MIASKKVCVCVCVRHGRRLTKRQTANNINKWNQVQEVLSAVPAAAAAPAPAQACPSAFQPSISTDTPQAAPAAVPTPAPAAAAEPEAPAEDADFSDPAGKVCLLCARQFKTPEQTRRHTRESDLHKVRAPPFFSGVGLMRRRRQKNMQDGALRDAARAKVLAARNAPAAADAPKYRDRASERRVMHNQPDAPMPEVTPAPAVAKAKQPSPPAPPGKDEANVGNKLLKMMGWKEGEGLGQHGEGIAEPMCVLPLLFARWG
jgi:RNA-binding protein 5/10